MVIPTSMGVRITPLNGQPVHSSQMFRMDATSAESNVGSTASYLGLPVKYAPVLNGLLSLAALASYGVSSRSSAAVAPRGA